jgi:hypothetical protein
VIAAATHEFATFPGDTLANTPFAGTLARGLRFDRSIMTGDSFGAMSVGVGELELINADGAYDDIVDTETIDGRRTVLKVGALGDPYDKYRTIFDGTANGWVVDEDVVRVTLRDNGYLLNKPASANLYGGTGGLDGNYDLKGKRKPRAFGVCSNVSPPLVDPQKLVFQVNDGPVQTISAVYDRGVPLTATAEYPTSAGMLAAPLPAGNYATCRLEGLFRLGGRALGTITADVAGDASLTGYVETTGGIVRRLLATAGIDTDDGIVGYSFAALEASQPAVVGYWLPVDGAETVKDVINALLGGIGAWGDFRRDGRFEVGRLIAPESGHPAMQYTDTEILSIRRERLPAGLYPPPWRFRVAYARNWTKQTDLAGAVSANRAAYLADEFRTVASADTRRGTMIKLAYFLAQDPEPRQSYFRDIEAAQVEADRLLTLFSPTRSLYRIVLRLQPLAHQIGTLIEAVYPRWDLAEGKTLRIVSLSEDFDERRIEVLAFG